MFFRYAGIFLRKVFLALITVSLLFSLILTTLLMTNKNQPLSDDKTNVLSASETSEPVSSQSATTTPEITEIVLPRKEIRIGVVVDDYANRQNSVTNLENSIGKQFHTISLFKQFGNQFNREFIEEDMTFAKQNGKQLLIAWEPWNPEEGMNQSQDYLLQIPVGNHDEYIKRFAQGVRSYGHPVTIRFGHEMNGNWYPWGNRPSDYIASYRYIVNLFRAEGVSNVSWMWSINAENVPASPISTAASFYPGAEYVDKIGLDGFNFGTTGTGSWRSFTSIFKSSYGFAASFSKPLSISETASSEIGGSKAEWIKSAFEKELPARFPLISEVVWFSLLKEADWRIDSSESSLNSFKSSLK